MDGVCLRGDEPFSLRLTLPRGYGCRGERDNREGAKVVQATGTATLRYWAAAREAAGASEEQTRAGTLGAALTAAVAERGADGDRLAHVLRRCSFLVDGRQVGKRDLDTVRLDPGAVVEILPPFAGG